MKHQKFFNKSPLFFVLLLVLSACESRKSDPVGVNVKSENGISPLKVIFDTDSNNELDDQHALAYLLSNSEIFQVEGVTVNATLSGGEIENHVEEAKRILQLYNLQDSIPLLKGANTGLSDILEISDSVNFDGKAAVDFILEKTKKDTLVLIAVGKLTNIALALKIDPLLAKRTRVVWLGSNYPKPGEYNQDNDTAALNAVLRSKIPFEMVTVRYGEPSGTDAVRVSKQEIEEIMPGVGPKALKPITGRHGGQYSHFGDYSVNLFEHIEYDTESKTRSLYDMVAVALLKNPDWGRLRSHPAPTLINNVWLEQPNNLRKIGIWENFDQTGLINDFYKSLKSK